MRLLIAWIMASQPPGMPTPSWVGARRATASLESARDIHFETSLLKTLPTAMGLYPPYFFIPAKSLPPKKKAATEDGIFPAVRVLTDRQTDVHT